MDSHPEFLGHGTALRGLCLGTNVGGFNPVKAGLFEWLQSCFSYLTDDHRFAEPAVKFSGT
jgi:hypothetical protein